MAGEARVSEGASKATPSFLGAHAKGVPENLEQSIACRFLQSDIWALAALFIPEKIGNLSIKLPEYRYTTRLLRKYGRNNQ